MTRVWSWTNVEFAVGKARCSSVVVLTFLRVTATVTAMCSTNVAFVVVTASQKTNAIAMEMCWTPSTNAGGRARPTTTTTMCVTPSKFQDVWTSTTRCTTPTRMWTMDLVCWEGARLKRPATMTQMQNSRNWGRAISRAVQVATIRWHATTTLRLNFLTTRCVNILKRPFWIATVNASTTQTEMGCATNLRFQGARTLPTLGTT